MIKNYRILRDTKEKVGYWDFEEDSRCLGTVSKGLKTGDYTVEGLEDILCIERKKTIGEICNNMQGDRFKKELERMSEFKYKFLILEFDLPVIDRFPLGSGLPKSIWPKVKWVTPQFLRRYFSEIAIEYGVHVIYASTRIQAQKICYSIIKRVCDAENL